MHWPLATDDGCGGTFWRDLAADQPTEAGLPAVLGAVSTRFHRQYRGVNPMGCIDRCPASVHPRIHVKPGRCGQAPALPVQPQEVIMGYLRWSAALYAEVKWLTRMALP